MASDARRGVGNRPVSRFTAVNALGPLIRSIAIAAGGAPLDNAKIVSALTDTALVTSYLCL